MDQSNPILRPQGKVELLVGVFLLIIDETPMRTMGDFSYGDLIISWFS